jgi:predicted dehydrogenase
MSRPAVVAEQAGTAVVVGYGSIGRRHAQLLAKMTPSLALVDAKAEARADGERDFPSSRVVESLASLDGEVEWASAVCVIATWGPSHAEVFHALADRGARRILCEKPMASSVALAAEMVERAARDRITLGVNHFIRHMRLAPALLRFAAEHGLGEPQSLVLDGGAACLVTNGLHWIDFGSELFGCGPRTVVGTAEGEPINPRSPDLMLYGGTGVLGFGSGREVVLSLNNRSSLALEASVYFRDAVAEVDGNVDRVVIRRRDRSAVERFPAVTRTGPASALLFDGQLPGMVPFPSSMERAHSEVARGGPVTCTGAHGAAAAGACIGLLFAARERRAVRLPIDPESPEGHERWPIS